MVHQEGGDSNLAGLIEGFLRYIWKSGVPDGYTWEQVKDIVLAKFTQVTRAYEAEQPLAKLPSVPNVDNYTFEEYRDRIVSCLNRFDDPPFTIGRICELLLEPRKHYDRGDKFLRAFEKCVAVTSTTSPNDIEMATVESSNQNDNQTAAVTENGTTEKPTMEKNAGENGHSEKSVTNGTGDQQKHDSTDNAVSSSVDGGHAKEQAAAEDNNKVESSTANDKKKEDDTANQGDDNRGDKRQAEETDSVAKKIARFENGEHVNGKHQEVTTGAEEPMVEPHGESNGHKDVPKDEVQLKRDNDVKTAADQEVTGQGTAV